MATYKKLEPAPPEYPPIQMRPEVPEGEEWDGVFEADLTEDEERAVIAAGWVEKSETKTEPAKGGKK